MLLPQQRRRTATDAEVVGSYVAGTVSGALLTGLVLWVLSGFAAPLPPAVRVWLLVVAALTVLSAKLGWLPLTLPESRRQIPAQVFGGSLRRGAYRFGLELGSGVRTYIPSPAPYVLALALILAQPRLGDALLASVGFGVGRGLPLVIGLSSPGRRALLLDRIRGAGRLAAATSWVLVLGGAIVLT